MVAEVHRSPCPIPGAVGLGELAKRQSVKLSYTAALSASHTLRPVPLKFRETSSPSTDKSREFSHSSSSR